MGTLRPRSIVLLLAALFLGAASLAHAGALREDCVVSISKGRFSPLFGLPLKEKDMLVEGFRIDCDAVTHQEFAAFLKRQPEWSQSEVAPLYADERYLAGFTRRMKLRAERETPVVEVSWFAADAYCAAKGGRLPTTLEWERVAAANATSENVPDSPEITALILDWYAKPTSDRLSQHRVALNTRNVFGVRGLHGVIWEWTSDFGSFRVNQDSRGQGGEKDGLFCGAAAATASSRTQYAAFMRYAMRSTLEGRFSLQNLGFRCAYDDTP